MYAEITFPLLRRTLAVFRCPEFGFLGFVIPTFRQIPFRNGRPTVAGERGRRAGFGVRPRVRTWFRVADCNFVVENVLNVCCNCDVRTRLVDNAAGEDERVRRRRAWRRAVDGAGDMIVIAIRRGCAAT